MVSLENGPSAAIRVLLFSDVENSTLLAGRLSADRVAEVWAAHDRCARDLLVTHDGWEIGRSDGMFLMFDQVARAARYAVGYQAAAAALELAPRVGLHIGPVTLRNNTSDDVARGAKAWEVEGPAIPVTARLMALARGGQTLMSRDAHDALARELPEYAQVERHGFYRLKGIEPPLEVYELGVRGKSPFQPPADVAKAYRVVRDHDVWLPVQEVRHNLPVERDAFVGRQRELRALAAHLAEGVRLVTVQGLAGTGKTRLCRRYAWAWLGDWPGGVYFCDLSEARSLDGLFFAVASALSVPLGRDDASEQLGRAIAGRGRSLVILDNFEQLVEQASATVGRWVDLAPQATFLATSRERLHLPGEVILPLDPLPVEDDAVDLFVRRSRAQDPGFALTEGNRAPIAEAVRLLDGLPLAIELAAARARLFAPEQLVVRLRQRFSVLTGTNATTKRQTTLRGAIDWSWELLTPWEQSALAQLSVFDGGFSVEAAEAVLDLRPWPQAPLAMDVLQALIDKSLLRSSVAITSGDKPAADPALGMYLSIHEYAAEKLAAWEPDAYLDVERRHGTFYARFGTEDAIAALSRRGGTIRGQVLASNRDNMMTACFRAIRRGEASCAVSTFAAAWALLEMRGPSSAGIAIGAQVIAMEPIPPVERVRALLLYGTALRRGGRTDEAAQFLEEGLALARHLSDQSSMGRILLMLGSVRADQHRMTDAHTLVEAARGIALAIGDRSLEGRVYNMIGILEAEEGDYEQARTHFAAALELHRELGDRRSEGADMANLANLMRMQGNLSEAIDYFERALATEGESGDRRVAGLATGNLGMLYGDLGRISEAHAYCERAIVMHREVGNRHAEGIIRGALGKLMARKGLIAEARAHFNAGEQLLRDVGDNEGVARLLCDRAGAELAADDREAARSALREAESIVVALNAGGGSDASRQVLELRKQIA